MLAFIKIVLGTVLALLLFLFFLQRDDEQEKMVKISDRLEALNTSVGDLSRKVAAVEIEARAAYERTDALLDVIERGGIRTAPRDSGGGARDPRPPDTGGRGEPTIIAGKKIYPRNKGWTVICDSKANEDPARDVPADLIDWDAVLMDYIAGEPASFNFLGPDRTATNGSLGDYAFDRLARPKTSNLEEYNALLAERVEMSPDRRVYMVYLRKGVLWHEPEPEMLKNHPWLKGEHYVTAKDVKFTWDIIRDPAANCPLAYSLDDLEKIEIVDEHTLRVTWKKADYYAKDTTVFAHRTYPEHIWAYDPDGQKYAPDDVGAAFANHWFAKSICGNGPYRFVDYKLGEHLRFVRNDKYWGPRAPCKEWIVQILPENETRLNKLLNNELVSMVLVPEADERCIKEGIPEKPFHLHADFDTPAKGIKRNHWLYFIYKRPLFGCFGWNMRKPKFKDKRVRQALTMSLNRFGIVEHIQKGRGEVIPVTQAPTDPNYPEGFEPLPFDLDRAAKLFEEAGWTDTDGDGIRDKMINGKQTPFEFTLIISNSSSTQNQIVQLYKEDLLKIGVKLVSDPVESALWVKRTTNREFDGFIIFWYAGYDDDPRQLWLSDNAERAGSDNYTGFMNEEADGIFEKLVTAFDKAERKKLFQRWFEIQVDEQAYTVIWRVHMPFAYMGSWRIPEPSLITPKNDRRLFWKWK